MPARQSESEGRAYRLVRQRATQTASGCGPCKFAPEALPPASDDVVALRDANRRSYTSPEADARWWWRSASGLRSQSGVCEAEGGGGGESPTACEGDVARRMPGIISSSSSSSDSSTTDDDAPPALEDNHRSRDPKGKRPDEKAVNSGSSLC